MNFVAGAIPRNINALAWVTMSHGKQAVCSSRNISAGGAFQNRSCVSFSISSRSSTLTLASRFGRSRKVGLPFDVSMGVAVTLISGSVVEVGVGEDVSAEDNRASAVFFITLRRTSVTASFQLQ